MKLITEGKEWADVKSLSFCCGALTEFVLSGKITADRSHSGSFSIRFVLFNAVLYHCPFCGAKIEIVNLRETAPGTTGPEIMHKDPMDEYVESVIKEHLEENNFCPPDCASLEPKEDEPHEQHWCKKFNGPVLHGEDRPRLHKVPRCRNEAE